MTYTSNITNYLFRLDDIIPYNGVFDHIMNKRNSYSFES